MSEQTITKKTKRERSAAYPAADLEEALGLLKDVHDKFGVGPYGREDAAKAMGYGGVNGRSAGKIAGLVHYNMLERVPGGGYKETPFGTELLNPIDEREFRTGLVKAFLSPSLFSRLMTDLGNRVLPQKLDVILMRNYRITEAASKEVAETFRKSAEYCGLLKNGFLSLATSNPEDTLKSEVNHNSAPESPAPKPVVNERSLASSGKLVIDLGGGVSLHIPQELALALATGKFGTEIDRLEKKIKKLGEGGRDEKAGEKVE